MMKRFCPTDLRRRTLAVRRLFAVVALIVLASVACDDADRESGEANKSLVPAPRRIGPNLLLITLDTTRADALGIYGQERPTSPSIDWMARSGAYFEAALTSSPLTLPSHSTIMSGKYPYAHGVRSNTGYVLPEQNITLAEILRARGYKTAAEVATDVLRSETRINQGFDHYRGPSDSGVRLKRVQLKETSRVVTRQIREGAEISEKGIEFLRANQGQSFFLWLHYFDAHQPYVVPAKIRKRFPDSRYHGAVAAEDEYVRRVIEEVERLGLREDTLVILTADHGEGLEEHGEDTHSYFVYDTTMHVPLVFWGLPEIQPGLVHSGVTRTIDIAPTALDLLGLRPNRDFQGQSLAALIKGEALGPPLLGYGESFESVSFFGLSPIRYVREGRWKYIHKVNPELYDIEADPGETRNLMHAHPEIGERLFARLEDLLKRAPASPSNATTNIDPETEAQLQALGYLGNVVTPDDFDEVASLELKGEDPASKTETVKAVAMAHALIENELYDQALAALLPLAEENPKSTYVLSRLVETRAARGEDEAALEVYRRVLALDSCEWRALTEMNRLLKGIGEYDKLVSILRQGVEDCPDFAGNLNNYAWALATLPRDDLRDGDEAVRSAERALEVLGERNSGFLDTLAVALAEAGRTDEAIAIASEALRAARGEKAPPELVDILEAHRDRIRAGTPIRSPEGETS